MLKKIICSFISILIITLSFSITNAEDCVTIVSNNIVHCEDHTMDFEIDNAGQNTCSAYGYTGTIEYTNKLDLGKYN